MGIAAATLIPATIPPPPIAPNAPKPVEMPAADNPAIEPKEPTAAVIAPPSVPMKVRHLPLEKLV